MSLAIILAFPVCILAFISSINVGTAMAEMTFRYCVPVTRCVEYSVCLINHVQQPCAYGSGGAL